VAAVGEGDVEALCPPFRPDLAREVDLVEEIVRVRGMDSVPTTYPAIRTGPEIPRRYGPLRRIREALRALGLCEAISFSFVSARELDAIGAPADLRVALRNPLSDDRSVMRTSLLPGLLAAAGRSRRAREPAARLFEVGRAYRRDPARAPLVAEPTLAAALLVGERTSWLAAPSPFDPWDGKGILEELVRACGGGGVDLSADPERLTFLHPRAAFAVRLDQVGIGWLGEVHPDVLSALDVLGPAIAFEVDADAIAARSLRPREVEPLPRFPAVERDVAVVLRDEVTAGAAIDLVRRVGGGLVESVGPFDLYRGGGVPEGHRSLALRVTYRASDRTLTDAEVDEIHGRVRESLAAGLGATIR
jgi:phenylalanyl-tRNA synthetase beta chain